MNDIGRPLYWDIETHLKAVVQMIRADELQIAISMIDQVPAWYRIPKNRPKELSDIRNKIYQQCYDIFLYGNDDDEASQTRETAEQQWLGQYCYPRAEIISKEVARLNEQGHVPWIYDLSCSHGNAGAGMAKMGLKFNYLGKSMNYRAANRLKEWISDYWQETPEEGQEKILICTEALEHAWDPGDIVRAAYKLGVEYNQIFLSTPLATLGGGLVNWDSRPLGHIRGWAPHEFMEWANNSFPGYQWAICEAHSMVLWGKTCVKK